MRLFDSFCITGLCMLVGWAYGDYGYDNVNIPG